MTCTKVGGITKQGRIYSEKKTKTFLCESFYYLAIFWVNSVFGGILYIESLNILA